MTSSRATKTTKQSSNTMRSMSARLARSLTGNRVKVNPVLEPLLSIHREFHPKADVELLSRAYDTAERLHEGVFRKSGDPYITHPLAVATIAAEIGMDTTTIIASLLHDTVEDTEYSLDDLTNDFGEEVARLVDGVTKLDKVALGAAAEAETIRKMVMAMAQDPRVLVIKVADRLHNMRTMRFLPPEKQAKKARQTLDVIAPLAHRLGMSSVKWELEDLSFAIPKNTTKWYDSSPTEPPHATATFKKSYRSSNKDSKKTTLMPRLKADQNTTGRSTKKWSCAAKTSTKSSTWWAYESSSTTSTTATQPSEWCTPYSQPCPADSKTTFPPQNSGCTNRSTPQSWATAANH